MAVLQVAADTGRVERVMNQHPSSSVYWTYQDHSWRGECLLARLCRDGHVVQQGELP
jgi:hypothetical protein